MLIIIERCNRTVRAACSCIYKIMSPNLANCDPVLHLLSGWWGTGTRWNASFELFNHHLKYNTIKNHKTRKNGQFPQFMRCRCWESWYQYSSSWTGYMYMFSVDECTYSDNESLHKHIIEGTE